MIIYVIIIITHLIVLDDLNYQAPYSVSLELMSTLSTMSKGW